MRGIAKVLVTQCYTAPYRSSGPFLLATSSMNLLNLWVFTQAFEWDDSSQMFLSVFTPKHQDQLGDERARQLCHHFGVKHLGGTMTSQDGSLEGFYRMVMMIMTFSLAVSSVNIDCFTENFRGTRRGTRGRWRRAWWLTNSPTQHPWECQLNSSSVATKKPKKYGRGCAMVKSWIGLCIP